MYRMMGSIIELLGKQTKIKIDEVKQPKLTKINIYILYAFINTVSKAPACNYLL